jgi:parallel beta-helix repeat protein
VVRNRNVAQGSAWFLATLLSTIGLGPRELFAACTVPSDDLVVTQDTQFCSGSYRIRDRAGNGVIIVGADAIVIDGGGMTLNGSNSSGAGIVVDGRSEVTIRNFAITKFYHAIRTESCNGIRIENNTLRANGGSGEQFYDINRAFSAPYGGGILAHRSINGVFQGNTGSDQNVGLDLYESTGNQILGNDFSSNLGWGIRLYASSANTISGNRADHVHGCRGSNCSARDTAGILLVFGSHQNTIAGNSFVDGGDGFFIGNENGLPSNGNLVEDNDCSSAVHNAIEATFSEGNVFRGNMASASTFGFWLGFSHDSTVEGNVIHNNRADGINWEHGRFGVVRGNEIAGNAGSGLVFRLTPNHPLIPRYPGSEAAHDHSVADNSIADNGSAGIRFLNTTDSRVEGNVVAGNAVNLQFEGASTAIAAIDNDLPCRSASGRTCQLAARNDMPAGNDVSAEWNWWGTDVEGAIDALVLDGGDDPSRGVIDFDPWRGCGDGICSTGESACVCPADCGAPPAAESLCTDGMDDDCDALVDCDDGDCAGSCPACAAAGESCQSAADCCSSKCKGSAGQRRCR